MAKIALPRPGRAPVPHQQRIERNLEVRQRIVMTAHTSAEVQRALMDRILEPDNGVLFWINHFLWTYDPRRAPYHFPFVLYPEQERVAREVHQHIQEGRGLLGEKSRDWGASFIWLAVFLYHFLFLEFEGLLLSLRQDEVDNPTVSSLFGKLRYMIRRLPYWQLPKKWSWARDAKPFLKILNPDNGNSLVGMATTADAGRSGRKTAVLIDEHAAIRNNVAEGMETALGHTTNSLHRLSTPRGINLFKALRDRGTIDVLTMHWSQIPPKCAGLYYIDPETGDHVPCETLPYERRGPYGTILDERGNDTGIQLRSTWYDNEERTAVTRRAMAQEVDISYLGSGYCRFDTAMLEEKSRTAIEGRKGYLVDQGDAVIFHETPPGQEYELEIWEMPQEPKFLNRSFIGVDTAEGKEHGDWCVGDVLVKNIRGDHATHAASLHGHWAPDIFATKLDQLGRFYDAGAMLVIERNKDGLGVILSLQNLHNYPNLYHEDKEHEKYGFYTTAAKKHIITGDLDEALRNGELTTRSINHYTEMSQYENVNGVLGATGSNNDDRVMALAIAWHVLHQTARPRSMTEKHRPVQRILRTRNLLP